LQKFCVQFRQSRVTAHERLWDSLKVRLQLSSLSFINSIEKRKKRESIIIAVVRDSIYSQLARLHTHTHTNIHNNARQERREKLVYSFPPTTTRSISR
jgi:hypothetical protein